MHKYRAKRTEVDGLTFDSQREARRYQNLRLLEKAGAIADLELQPYYTLEVNDIYIGAYYADFGYYPCHESGPHKGAIIGHRVIEDSKGFRTPLYKWKKKHVEAQYGITILET